MVNEDLLSQGRVEEKIAGLKNTVDAAELRLRSLRTHLYRDDADDEKKEEIKEQMSQLRMSVKDIKKELDILNDIITFSADEFHSEETVRDPRQKRIYWEYYKGRGQREETKSPLPDTNLKGR